MANTKIPKCNCCKCYDDGEPIYVYKDWVGHIVFREVGDDVNICPICGMDLTGTSANE